MGLSGACALIDRRLMRLSSAARGAVITVALLASAGAALPNVPRAFFDYSRVPVLQDVPQPENFGTDSIADMYAARVVRNDLRDMYTKRHTDQTPLERATWSKEASSPYPPATLLAFAGLAWIGDAFGIGLYGMVLTLALVFVVASLVYCLETRWYVFPVMALAAPYIGTRFVQVQDGSYLVMLVLAMAALFLARRRSQLAHVVMALAICVKLSPLYYLVNVLRMRWRWAFIVLAVVFAGLVLPVFVWEGYLSIYSYQAERKGLGWLNMAGTLALVGPFSLTLWFAESRRGFDMEDCVGWGLVPFAAFMAITMNSARHLFLVLLVPDKRGLRTAAGVAGMVLHLLFPRQIRSGSAVYIILALLWLVLGYYVRHPAGTREPA